ncbi:MAG TPA: transcriptional regulator [Afifellaceae bacterium]|nr:transcriptional regulator [Afifellaceae bacterium]
MKTVTFGVARQEDVSRRAEAAFRGEAQGAHISFASLELLFSLMTAKRWQIVRAMAGAGPMSIRAVARRVGRDVKAVHGDVQALLSAGIIEKADGRVVFPYEAVHVDVVVKAA